MSNHILIVDDDKAHGLMLETLLKKWQFKVSRAENGVEAIEKIKETPYDSVLMDIRMPDMDGVTALKFINAYNPAIPIIMMTAFSDIENAVECVKNGAYDYLTKPLDFDRLKITIDKSLEHAKLKKQVQTMEIENQTQIIGSSKAITQLKELIKSFAPSDATILIRGKSGTGKELVARSIYELSQRKDKPFVTVNCGALSETLLESELFGHEKGAFTGADKKREGRFFQANGGTIFLDEIGEISPQMQVKLLRVLQQKEIQRVGSDETLHVDVRIIAATNRNLEDEIQKGNFREDLYYRLNVVTLDVPALNEREGDIPILAQHFLTVFSKKNNKEIKGFTPKAMDCLIKHEWRGNVRELENVIERACILTYNDYIDVEQFPQLIQNLQSQKSDFENVTTLEEMEKAFILKTLKEYGDNKSETAKQLGISRKTLHTKIKQYNLESE